MRRKTARVLTLLILQLLGLLMVNRNFKVFHSSQNENIEKTEFEAKTKGETTYFLSDSCQCHSLFTLSTCNKNYNPYFYNITVPQWKDILDNVKKKRVKDPQTYVEHLHALARELTPKAYTVQIENSNYSQNLIDTFLSGRIHYNYLKPEYITKLPFSFCTVEYYEPDKVQYCLRKIKKRIGRPLRMYFMGDSLERQMLEDIVKDYKDILNLKGKGEMSNVNLDEKFLNHKVKSNLPIIGDDIHLRLYWAPYLARKVIKNATLENEDVPYQGALDVLQRWYHNKSSEKEDSLPDLLCTGFGSWRAYHEGPLSTISKHFNELTILKPLLKKLAKRTRILWNVHHEMKEGMYRNLKINTILPYLDALESNLLSDTDIWMWDSWAVFAMRDVGECRVYREANITRIMPLQWQCNDWQHPGLRTRKATINMLWNLICNKEMGNEKENCCS